MKGKIRGLKKNGNMGPQKGRKNSGAQKEEGTGSLKGGNHTGQNLSRISIIKNKDRK